MTTRNAASAIIVLYGLLGVLPLTAGEPPAKSDSVPVPTLLERMSHAVETLNYKGTFVYMHGGRFEAMQVIHRSDGGEERLTSLSGPPREVVRRQNKVECILPRKQLVVVNEHFSASRFPMIMPAASGTRDLGKYYHFKHAGSERVAGRNCRVVILKPRDQYRYGYRLWLDAENNLLLRSELTGIEGKVIERVAFTHIETPDRIPAEAIAPAVDTNGFKRRSRPTTVAADDSSVKIKIDHLPPGYRMTADESQHLHGIESSVRHLVFTDGLASMSVFAVPHKTGKDVLRGPSQRGPVNAYGRVVDGYHVTVVGDVPAAAVKMVAQSARIVEASADTPKTAGSK
jgi:sigma-E factor negative regulatory protein RseB